MHAPVPRKRMSASKARLAVPEQRGKPCNMQSRRTAGKIACGGCRAGALVTPAPYEQLLRKRKDVTGRID